MSPLRRVNQAIALLTIGAREASFRNVKSIAECLAEELINAAKGSSNSYAIKKKDELERYDQPPIYGLPLSTSPLTFISTVSPSPTVKEKKASGSCFGWVLNIKKNSSWARNGKSFNGEYMLLPFFLLLFFPACISTAGGICTDTMKQKK